MMIEMTIEKNIKNWLVDEGVYRDKKIEDNVEFHYIVEFPKDNMMDIVKPKGKDCVVIGCATQVAQQHLTLMNESSPNNRKNFILDVNFGLNNFLVDYELQINQDLLQGFIITDEIFSDGLTKHSFIKTMKRVFKAKLHCIWLIEKTFGKIDQPKNSVNDNTMFV